MPGPQGEPVSGVVKKSVRSAISWVVFFSLIFFFVIEYGNIFAFPNGNGGVVYLSIKGFMGM